MQANKRRDTRIELAVRSALHKMGLRFRVDYAPIKAGNRADIVFTRKRIAVFLDGCFWHGCPTHHVPPKSNMDYWIPKIRTNMERDLFVNDQLTSHGWTVLRYWSHEGIDDIVASIAAIVLNQPTSQNAMPINRE